VSADHIFDGLWVFGSVARLAELGSVLRATPLLPLFRPQQSSMAQTLRSREDHHYWIFKRNLDLQIKACDACTFRMVFCSVARTQWIYVLLSGFQLVVTVTTPTQMSSLLASAHFDFPWLVCAVF
jgi:hypothetical protein